MLKLSSSLRLFFLKFFNFEYYLLSDNSLPQQHRRTDNFPTPAILTLSHFPIPDKFLIPGLKIKRGCFYLHKNNLQINSQQLRL